MARPKAQPFTLGTITYRPHPTADGQVQARGYYNDGNGKRVEATAMGATEPKARRALQAKVLTHSKEHRGGDEFIRHCTTVSQAAEVWLDWKRRQRKNGKPLAPGTIDEYEGYVLRCITGGTVEATGKVWPASTLAHLTIAEANDVGRIEGWLARIANGQGETAAKQAKKVLGGIFKLAERRNAIAVSVVSRVETPGAATGSAGDNKCDDSECDYDCGKRHLDTDRALTVEEADRLQDEADASRADIADLTEFLFGTGVRISEALHCVSWPDIDLDAQTVHVRGTKTARADRVLGMSDELTARLRKRTEVHGTTGLVFGVTRFPAKLGQPRDVSNVLRTLRAVMERAGLQWAGSHTFRRTVASWMDEAGCSLAEIANQLGHADTNVTARYLGRKTQPTKAATVMVRPPRKPMLSVAS